MKYTKWAIINGSYINEVVSYMNKKSGSCYTGNAGKDTYYSFDEETLDHHCGKRLNGHTEISIEEFRLYVSNSVKSTALNYEIF